MTTRRVVLIDFGGSEAGPMPGWHSWGISRSGTQPESPPCETHVSGVIVPAPSKPSISKVVSGPTLESA